MKAKIILDSCPLEKWVANNDGWDDRFKDIIINRAKYYAHILRSDLQSAQLADREYKEGLKALRVEYINNFSYMTDHRVNNGGRMGGY